MTRYQLPAGLPIPAAEPSGLSKPFWDGLRDEKIMVQRNPKTGVCQFPPQWICHDTQSFEIEWVEVATHGVIHSWTRAWHPVHPALKEACPYIIVVVSLPHAGGVRMLGNLLGDPLQAVEIGASVEAAFEHHNDSDPPFTLLHWRVAGFDGE